MATTRAKERDKVVKVCKDIQESNHSMKYVIQFHTNEEQVNINSIPWMFMEQQSNVVKEVTRKIKFPASFCANLKNVITKKGDFAGVKTHDWHVFIKVIIIVMSIYFFLFVYYFFNKWCGLYIDIVCSTSLSPRQHRQQCKQFIYNLGKYMR